MVCAAIGVALLTAAWRFLTFTGFNNDHYIYLAGAQQIVLGEWPIRDFVDPGWPLMYGVSAVARLLFGRELWVELLVVASAFAIGAGFTLTAAASVAFLELGWTPAKHDQAEDRVHRIGQDRHVTAWYLLAAETIDETMAELIQSKRRTVAAITDGRRIESDGLVDEVIRALRDGDAFRHLRAVQAKS